MIKNTETPIYNNLSIKDFRKISEENYNRVKENIKPYFERTYHRVLKENLIELIKKSLVKTDAEIKISKSENDTMPFNEELIADFLLKKNLDVLPVHFYIVQNNARACSDCINFSSFYGHDSMCDYNYENSNIFDYPEVNNFPVCPKQFWEIAEFKSSCDYSDDNSVNIIEKEGLLGNNFVLYLINTYKPFVFFWKEDAIECMNGLNRGLVKDCNVYAKPM